jgi:hypothetical protein
MLLDRYLRSLDVSGLSAAAGRDPDAADRPAPEESLAAAPTEAFTETPGRNNCVYMLTRPDDGGLEWTLTFTAAEGPSWSMALTARGAGPQAPIRVAEAVAVRVLAGFGVEVQGWAPGDPAPLGPRAAGPSPGYCAVLTSTATRPQL